MNTPPSPNIDAALAALPLRLTASCEIGDALADTTIEADRLPLLAELSANQAWLAACATAAPLQFAHLVTWLEAERRAALDQPWAALATFEQALHQAQQQPLHHALITERMGRFCLQRGIESAGRLLLTQAYALYLECGAEESRRQWHERYPFLLTPDERDTSSLAAALHAEIAERKRAEALAQKQKEQLQLILDASRSVIWFKDTANNSLRVNKAAAALLGRTVEEIEGKTGHELFPAHAAQYFADDLEVIQSGKPKLGIIEAVPSADGTRWVQTDKIPWFDDTGAVAGVILFAIDITERKRVEAELRETRDYLRNLLEYANAPIIVWDAAFRITQFNKAFERLTGRSAAHVLGQTLAWLFPEDERQASLNYIYSTTGARWETVEIAIQALDGTIHTLLWNSAMIYANDGETVVATIAQGQDITERKRAEETLRQSEIQYRLLTENMVDVIWTMNPLGQFTYVSPSVETLRGYTPQEVLQQSPKEVLSPASLLIMQSAIANHMALIQQGTLPSTFEAVSYELEQPCKDGSTVWTETLVKILVDLHGAFRGFLGVSRDITKRRRAEEALRETRDYLGNLLDYANAPIIVWDADFTITQFNKAFERLTGRSADSVVGQTLAWLFPENQREASLNYIYSTTGARWETVEIAIQSVEGAIHTLLWNSAMIYADDGETVVATIAQGQDITERKRAEAALAKAKDVAEAATRAKSEFLSNMSHELRTPLNAILGFSELMSRDPKLTPDQKENLTIINRSGAHLLSLINDVLDMSKIESGYITLQEHVFDLYQLLDELGELFRLRALAKRLKLIFTRDPEVPRFVCADEGKLRQVLINLLGNAVKFTTVGGISLHVYQATTAEPQRFVFAVQDTGQGIASDDLEAIFESFMQAPNRRSAQEGTGLGLPISRRFAHLMGGDLIALSSGVPGKGSLFLCEVPLRRAKAFDLAALQAREHTRAIGLEPGQPTYRLLVVDDRIESSTLLTKLLTQLGFAVRTAENGKQAIHVWQEWQPHLIWMDMRMPIMNGHEAARRIKATTEGLATVIIALTASVFEEQRALVLSDGCDDFVRKPFREDQIVDRLIKHLGVRMIYENVAAPPAVAPKQLLDADTQLELELADVAASSITELQQAALAANAGQLLLFADQIATERPALASALRTWVDTYDYDAILTIIARLQRGER